MALLGGLRPGARPPRTPASARAPRAHPRPEGPASGGRPHARLAATCAGLHRRRPEPRPPGPPVPRPSAGPCLGATRSPGSRAVRGVCLGFRGGPFRACAVTAGSARGPGSASRLRAPALARRVGAPGDGRPEAPCEEEPGCPGAPRSPSGPVRRPPPRSSPGPCRARPPARSPPPRSLSAPGGSRVVACRPLRPDPATVPDARRLGRAHDTCEAGAAGPSPSPSPCPLPRRREAGRGRGTGARPRPAGGGGRAGRAGRAGRPGRRERPRHGDPAADAPRNTSPGGGGGGPATAAAGENPPQALRARRGRVSRGRSRGAGNDQLASVCARACASPMGVALEVP